METITIDTKLVSQESALYWMKTCGYPDFEINKVMSNFFCSSNIEKQSQPKYVFGCCIFVSNRPHS